MVQLRYELRAVGRLPLLLPLLTILCLAAVAAGAYAALRQNGATTLAARFVAARVLLLGVELVVPLVVGFATARLVTQDPVKELLMSLPQAYDRAIARRLGLYLLWTIVLVTLQCLVAQAINCWIVPRPQLEGQLAWLAPLLFTAALGALLSLLGAGHTASAAMLALLAMGQLFLVGFFRDHPPLHPLFLVLTSCCTIAADAGASPPFVPDWLASRLALLTLGLALLSVSGLLLRRNEALLAGEG